MSDSSRPVLITPIAKYRAMRRTSPDHPDRHDCVRLESTWWRLWRICGMAGVRVSTTVDESLLEEARRLRSESNDAALLDEALAALLTRYRAAQIDAAYAAYDAHPMDEPR